MTAMPASDLIERVAQLIEGFVGRVSDPLDRELRSLLLRLREPMRVAVVGRVKAGKSTIVNALLGQRVAPTDVSECTRLVTWFRYGYPQRIELLMKDGSEIEIPMTTAGMLPDELPVPSDKVNSIQAYLTNDTLKDLILIDTPGIGSVNEEYSLATEELLAMTAESTAATGQADAVVFLLNQVVMENEHQALQMLASGAEDTGSAANTVGVLSKADQLGDGERDSWQIAVELATRYTERFDSEMSTVVPVIGLLAETSEAASLTEHDVKQLSHLAHLEPEVLEPMLWSPDRFVESESSPVPRPDRERLLVLLDLYGISQAIDLLREGEIPVTALRQKLASRSGIADVRRVITSLFNSQDDVLKVRSVLDLLNRMSYRREGSADAVLHQLRSKVEELRIDPIMHRVAEIEAWHACCGGKVHLPDDLRKDFQRLVTPSSLAARLGVPDGDPAIARQAAKAAMARWRSFMVSDADPGQASVARVAMRSYQIAYAAAAEPPIASIQSNPDPTP